MPLLGIDVGSTHCKAGVLQGGMLRVAARPTPVRGTADGGAEIDPQALWEAVCAAVVEALRGCPPGDVEAVGIASMAESGLLIDRSSGMARSAMIPWWDTRAAPHAAQIARAADPLEQFQRSGLRPSYKAGLAKILWLAAQGVSTQDATWLSAADYIAYRLSGRLGTDFTLAARTLAFSLDRRAWDEAWIERLGLDPALFPPAYPSGTPVGALSIPLAGLADGIPICVAGHDHLCAAFGAGATEPGTVLDSLGTAEVLVGALADRPLDERAFKSGFIYGLHVLPGRRFWMGSLSASGGSVEWLRGLLAAEGLSYEGLLALLDQAAPGPTGIVYLPYLAGSGAPHPAPAARAALFGLSAAHGRAELAKAVLEGTAYEIEYMRRAAAAATGEPVERVVAAGGGTRNRVWMQIKADVLGCPLAMSSTPEATLLGAALLAGGADAGPEPTGGDWYEPDPERHRAYEQIYEQSYLPLLSVVLPSEATGRAIR